MARKLKASRRNCRNNHNNGIRPAGSLRKSPVDDAKKRIECAGGKTIIGNLGNPGKYKQWGPMKTYHECHVDVVTNTDIYKLYEYAASEGRHELIEELSKMGIRVDPRNTVLCPGISNLVDPIYRMILSVLKTVRKKYNDGNIVMVTPNYVLYLWEAQRMGIEIIACRMINGQIDLESLRSKIDGKTRAVIFLDTGNPIAIPTIYNTYKGVFDIVNKAERRYHHPIVVMIDDVYRVFRDIPSQQDLPNALLRAGRGGPTILLDSASKMTGIAGERIGWAKLMNGQGFEGKTNDLVERIIHDLQITLGTVAMSVQLSFLEFVKRIAEGEEFAERAWAEMADRRKRVRKCNTEFMKALINQEGIELHRQYGFNGKVDPNLVVAPYVVFGFDPKIMNVKCQAAQLAMDAHDLGMEAPLFTPMNLFELEEGKVHPGMRAVPMWDDSTRNKVVEAILAVRDKRMKR